MFASADGRGMVGARSVTGVHQATPTTVARQSPSRAVRSSALLEWGKDKEYYLTLLSNLNENGERLFYHFTNSVWILEIGIFCIIQIMKSSSLVKWNLKKVIGYLSVGNVIRSSTDLNLRNNRICSLCAIRAIGNLQNEYSYVLQFPSISLLGYSLVELFGEDCSTEPKTAVGQLRAEVQRRGLDLRRSDVHMEPIGTFTGPDGGGNDDSINPKIKHGMTIEASGIVVDIVARPIES